MREIGSGQTQVCRALIACFVSLTNIDMTSDIESPIPVEQTNPNISERTVKTARTAGKAMDDDGRVDCDCGTMVI